MRGTDRQGSGSSSEEQWTVVEKQDQLGGTLYHAWRVVVFKNGLGQLRTGLKCDWCTMVVIPRPGAWNSHGQRVEKAKP